MTSRKRNAPSSSSNTPMWDIEPESDDFFMTTAFLVSKQSKDPSTKVGAVIVNADNKIVGQGYNCMPGVGEDYPWDRENKDNDETKTKYAFVCHAEMNAILNKTCGDLKGSKIYTTLYPCNECTKMIIQAEIEEVVYAIHKYQGVTGFKAAEIMLEKKRAVRIRQFCPKENVVINFPPQPPKKMKTEIQE